MNRISFSKLFTMSLIISLLAACGPSPASAPPAAEATSAPVATEAPAATEAATTEENSEGGHGK